MLPFPYRSTSLNIQKLYVFPGRTLQDRFIRKRGDVCRRTWWHLEACRVVGRGICLGCPGRLVGLFCGVVFLGHVDGLGGIRGLVVLLGVLLLGMGFAWGLRLGGGRSMVAPEAVVD